MTHPSDSRSPLADLVLRKLPLRPTAEMLAAAEEVMDAKGRLRGGPEVVWRKMADAFTALAAPGGEGEPVAWRIRNVFSQGYGPWKLLDAEPNPGRDFGPVEVQALVPAPPEPVAWRPDRDAVMSAARCQYRRLK